MRNRESHLWPNLYMNLMHQAQTTAQRSGILEWQLNNPRKGCWLCPRKWIEHPVRNRPKKYRFPPLAYVYACASVFQPQSRDREGAEKVCTGMTADCMNFLCGQIPKTCINRARRSGCRVFSSKPGSLASEFRHRARHGLHSMRCAARLRG